MSAASLQTGDSPASQDDGVPSTNDNRSSSKSASASHTLPLALTFAGDLMAHTVNFNMNEYDLIYKDVEKYYIMMI